MKLDHAAAVEPVDVVPPPPFCRACRSGLGRKASIPANLGCGRYGNADRLDFSGGCLRLVGFVFAGGAAGGQQ